MTDTLAALVYDVNATAEVLRRGSLERRKKGDQEQKTEIEYRLRLTPAPDDFPAPRPRPRKVPLIPPLSSIFSCGAELQHQRDGLRGRGHGTTNRVYETASGEVRDSQENSPD